jgi:hypothetical protein
VAATVTEGQDQLTTDLAQTGADVISRVDRLEGTVREGQRETVRALTPVPLPSHTRVYRDADGRISGTVVTQGDRMLRRIVERDPDGRVISLVEVAA